MIRPVPRGAHFAIRAARNGAYIIRKPDRALHFTQTAFKELYFWIDRSYLLVLRSLMAKEGNKKPARKSVKKTDCLADLLLLLIVLILHKKLGNILFTTYINARRFPIESA